MAIARVTMMEFFDESGMGEVEKIYAVVRDDLFSNLLQVISIQLQEFPSRFIHRLKKQKKILLADKKCLS